HLISGKLLAHKHLDVLYQAFRIRHYPSSKMIQQLSTEIGVAPDRLRVWFNNHRQQYKRQEPLARIALRTFSSHSGCALTRSPMPIITQVTSGEEPFLFTASWNPSATMARTSGSRQNPSVLPPPSSVPRLYPSYNRPAPTNSTWTTTLGYQPTIFAPPTTSASAMALSTASTLASSTISTLFAAILSIMGCKTTKKRKQKVNEKHSLIRNHPNDDQEQLPINMKGITLIWYDTNIHLDTDDDNDNEDIHHTMELLKENYIKSIENEKLFLITYDKCAIHLLPLIHQQKQIDSIYLFCLKQKPYEYLIKDYSKIISVYIQQQELIDSIRKNVYLVEKHMATFTFYDKTKQNSIRDLFNEPASFLWLLLFKDVITRIPVDNQAKQELVEKCLEYYHDLCENLKKEYQIIKENFDILTVYHGGRLRDDELEKRKNHKNQLISTDGFFSTSLSKETAFLLPGRSTDTKKQAVIYEIECNLIELNDAVIFAHIARFSDIPDEDEVLFEIGATFEVVSIKHDETLNMWIVKLKTTDKNSKIANDHIETNRKEMNESSSKIMFDKLLSEIRKYDKSQEYFENLLANPKDGDIAEIYSCQYERALEYQLKSLNITEKLFPLGHPSLAFSLNNTADVYEKMNNLNIALEYYERALIMYKQFLPKEHLDIVRTEDIILIKEKRKLQQEHD
ncbi:unnamed protein product, partial [Didymodactylos carnosus]